MKRLRQLRDLSDDHHTGLVLARRCRRSPEVDAAETLERLRRLVHEAFAGHLEPHFRIEEEHLLPALETIGEAPLARRIRDDHQALRALACADAMDRASLSRFGELLDAHIRFEERQVFERVQHRLPDDVLDAIAAACDTTPRVCPASLQP